MKNKPYKVSVHTGEYICGVCDKKFPMVYKYKTDNPRVMSTRSGFAAPAAANFYRHLRACESV